PFCACKRTTKKRISETLHTKKTFSSELFRPIPDRHIGFRSRYVFLARFVIDTYMINAFQHLLEYLADGRYILQRNVAVDELFLVHLGFDDLVNDIVEALRGGLF